MEQQIRNARGGKKGITQQIMNKLSEILVGGGRRSGGMVVLLLKGPQP